MKSLGAALASVLLAVSATTSCSSTGGPTTNHGAEGSLQRAMASVSGTGAASKDFEFGDLARQRALGIIAAAPKASVNRLWSKVAGFGLGNFPTARQPLQQLIALDLFAADTAVSIGQPPDAAVRLDGGVDGAAIAKKLTALGARSRTIGNASGLSFGSDNEVNTRSPFIQYAIVSQLDQIVARGDSFSASANGATLQKALGGGTSLLDTAGYRAVSSCLGDVIAAWSVAGKTGNNSSIVAVGVRDPGSTSGAHREVACFAPADGKAAAVQAAVRKQLALTSTDSVTGTPLAKYLSGSAVDTPDGLVRVTHTLRSTAPPGLLLTGMGEGLQRVWDGTCADAAALRTGC